MDGIRDGQQSGDPLVQAPDVVAAVVAMKRYEHKIEVHRRHVDKKFERLERRIEEVASTAAAGGHWAVLQGQVDCMTEVVQDLVRRFEIASPGFNGIVVSTKADDDVVQIPTFHKLSERVTKLEEWTQRDADTLETELTAKIIDTLEDMQSHCDRHLDQCRAEHVRQIANLKESFTELDKRVAYTERDLVKGLAQFREQVTLCQADTGKPSCVTPAAEGGVAVGRDAASGIGYCVDIAICDAEELPQNSEFQECRLDELASMSEEMHHQIVALNSRCLFVERAVQDFEQGMQDMWMNQCVRDQVDLVAEHMMKLGMRRTAETSDSSAPLDSVALELQSEVSAMSEDVVSIHSQVHLLGDGLDQMSRAFARVCDELVELRRKSQSGDCL